MRRRVGIDNVVYHHARSFGVYEHIGGGVISAGDQSGAWVIAADPKLVPRVVVRVREHNRDGATRRQVGRETLFGCISTA